MIMLFLILIALAISTTSATSEWSQHKLDSKFHSTENHQKEKRYDITSSPVRYERLPSFSSFFAAQRRDVPEALIDPYSVLGVLSFTVYVSYILYHRYQMNHKKKEHIPSGTPAFFNAPTSDQNLAYLIDVATKILQNAEKQGSVAAAAAKEVEAKQNNNGTLAAGPVLETLDYYDDNENETDTGPGGNIDLKIS